MPELLTGLNGYKVYITLAIGALAILAQHFLGITIPGVTYNDTNWMADIWGLVLAAASRSAVAKVTPPK